MAVLILEGVNGVGKSTYAKALNERLGLPIVRAFRHSETNKHWGADTAAQQEILKAARVPFNTHVEDIFVADCLVGLKASGILDRSVPTAIAYGMVYGNMDGYYNTPGNARMLMTLWQSIIMSAPGPIVYAWLRAPHDVAKKRCEKQGRPIANKKTYDAIERVFSKLFHTELTMTRQQINTAEIDTDDGVNLLCRLLKTSGNG